MTTQEQRKELRERMRIAAGGTPSAQLTQEQQADAFDYIYRSRSSKITLYLEMVHKDGERATCWEERYAQDVSLLLETVESLRNALLAIARDCSTEKESEFHHTLHVDIPATIEDALRMTGPRKAE